MTTPLRLLLIEDSAADASLLLRLLRKEDYDVVMERVDTAERMGDALRRQQWDLVIADHSMPSFGARTALQLLRRAGRDLPVIIVSGTISEEQAVDYMREGAVDYLLKDRLGRLGEAVQRALADNQLRIAKRQADQQVHFQARLLDAVEQAVIATGLDGTIIYWNRFAEHLYGWAAPEVEGRNFLDVVPLQALPGHAPVDLSRLVRWNGELLLRHRDGHTFPAQVSNSPIYDDHGTLVGVVGVSADITAHKQAEEALRHRATHDPLTDLPNRALFVTILQQALQHAGDHAVLLLGLDRFKEVNDTLGHAHGDVLLQQVAARLCTLAPPEATVARLGGDEFAILLPQTDESRAGATTRAMREALTKPFAVAGLTFDVEVSIGIAWGPAHGEDAQTLLRCADVALHAAKHAPEGFVVYTHMRDTHSPERLSLLSELRRGIEQDQLFLVFQPKLRLADQRVCGVEALVRWKHPLRGLIPPDQFIPLAEGTGAIKPLTQWVLDAAIRQCGIWRRDGLDLPVAVNLSVRNLHDALLPEAIRALLGKYHVPPGWLTLELTESAIMDDPAGALAMLSRLGTLGTHLEIDDFGTGYSSLGYLKRLPVDGLKVDRSFVRQLVKDANDTAIVASTVGLAHSLGLHVVAEGVESQEALERLTTLGCDVAQGYYLSRPLTAPDLAHWYETWPGAVRSTLEV